MSLIVMCYKTNTQDSVCLLFQLFMPMSANLHKANHVIYWGCVCAWQKFACNGTVIEHPEYGEVIQLQGDQRKNICQFLMEVSFFQMCGCFTYTCWMHWL